MCLMLFMQCQQDKALNAVIYILFASSNWTLGAVVETSEVSLRQLLISTSVKLLLKWVDFFLSLVWSGEYLIQLWNFCFDVQQWSKSECMPSIPGWVGADQGWLESRSLPSFSCLFLALNFLFVCWGRRKGTVWCSWLCSAGRVNKYIKHWNKFWWGMLGN